MSFVVNGEEWKFDGVSDDEIIETIENILDFVAISLERDEKVLVGDDFLEQKMLEELTLWELFSQDSPITIPPEIFQELTAWQGRDPLYTNEEYWPEGLENDEISVNGEPATSNIDLAWVHHVVRNKKAMACYSRFRQGCVSTVSDIGTAKVHFVNSEENRINFWQHAIVLEGDNVDSLLQYSHHAYPNLFFMAMYWEMLHALLVDIWLHVRVSETHCPF